MRDEFVRFLLVGISNTLFSYIVYLLLLSFLTYLPAYSIAYCAGVSMSYFLNARFVFKKIASLNGFLKFPIVYVIQYLLGAVILLLIVGKLGVPQELAMIGVVVITIPITFIASRFVLSS